MFGPFRASFVPQGGLLWKIPWRMSSRQKYRQRKRLQEVDHTIELLTKSLAETNQTCKAIEKLNDPAVFPKESEMAAKDKYTIFSRHSKGYRKGLHKVPKWTKVSHRVNPENF
ncbi:mitochondrial 54S ribosomal protein YmL31 [Saccharomycopsis crataegensis]|uniref:Large ribosomal subunit protein mL60 n=1 Tax=Saccharomycopsis crataegensis TaxID=43959 RepID=A0AAV5QUI0_9ASCO|nr:mitochondrial 54S ribosomal protein YmL31 [Saccharomycopsis crataegensis]